MGGEGQRADDAPVAQQRQYWRQHDVNLASAWGRRVAPEASLPEQRAATDAADVADVIVLPDADAQAGVVPDAAAASSTPAAG